MAEQPSSPFPPVTTLPDPGIYRALGQGGMENLLVAVYRRLAQSSIAPLFPSEPEALEAAAKKSALFFVGICGGPPLYQEKFGHPRMRDRHMKFKIDEAARQTWVDCWDQVLDTAPRDLGFPQEHVEGMRSYLHSFSFWMVNA